MESIRGRNDGSQGGREGFGKRNLKLQKGSLPLRRANTTALSLKCLCEKQYRPLDISNKSCFTSKIHKNRRTELEVWRECVRAFRLRSSEMLGALDVDQ